MNAIGPSKCYLALAKAKANKNDEFYTLYSDVEEKMSPFIDNFKDATIYCCCDDYRWSNFPAYFEANFKKLYLHKLVATSFNINDCSGVCLILDKNTRQEHYSKCGWDISGKKNTKFYDLYCELQQENPNTKI